MNIKEIYDMLVPYADAIWKIMLMLQLFILCVILLSKKK